MVSIIIPIYYLPELYLTIKDCLDSVKKYYPDFELITIDDCSPDECPFDVAYKNEVNLGFTGTVNKGLELAQGDVLIVANDDLKFKEGDLDRFYNIDDGIYFPRDSASGNCDTFGAIWGMTRSTYEKLGPMNTKYKNYFSDNDYYQRCVKAELPIVKWDDIIVEHKESATYNLLNKKELFEKDSMA